MLAGCQGSATTETTEGTGGAGTTGGSKPVASSPGHVGIYHGVVTDQMKKDNEANVTKMKAQVEEMKKTNPTQAAEMEKLMKEMDPLVMIPKMALELKSDNTFAVTVPMGENTSTSSGTYVIEGEKITMTSTMNNGEPVASDDKQILSGTYSPADETIIFMEKDVPPMHFKKG